MHYSCILRFHGKLVVKDYGCKPCKVIWASFLSAISYSLWSQCKPLIIMHHLFSLSGIRLTMHSVVKKQFSFAMTGSGSTNEQFLSKCRSNCLELCGALYCFGLYPYAWTGDQSTPKAASILLIVQDARDGPTWAPPPCTCHHIWQDLDLPSLPPHTCIVNVSDQRLHECGEA